MSERADGPGQLKSSWTAIWAYGDGLAVIYLERHFNIIYPKFCFHLKKNKKNNVIAKPRTFFDILDPTLRGRVCFQYMVWPLM